MPSNRLNKMEYVPDEVILSICEHLSPIQLSMWSATSTRWYTLITNKYGDLRYHDLRYSKTYITTRTPYALIPSLVKSTCLAGLMDEQIIRLIQRT